jgi:hypothetical protein
MARLLARKTAHPDFEIGMIVEILEDGDPWSPGKVYQPIDIPGATRADVAEWLDGKFSGPVDDPHLNMDAMRRWKVDMPNWDEADENYVENDQRPVAERLARLMAHKLDV